MASRAQARRLRQRGDRLLAAAAGLVAIDGRGRRVFLHVEPAARGPFRIGLVEIDREGVFGHVRVVEPVAGNLLAPRPGRELVDVLLQAIREHLRARTGARGFGIDHRRPARLARLHELGGLDRKPQQPAFDGPVHHAMRAARIDGEFAAERGIAGKDRRLPAAIAGCAAFRRAMRTAAAVLPSRRCARRRAG